MSLIDRIRLRWFGSCQEEGCARPQCSSFGAGLGYCLEHYLEHRAAFQERIRRAEFDRQANIIAEGIRRSRP